MTKQEFRDLFLRALEVAASNAEATTKTPISRSFLIELHAARSAGGLVSIDQAIDQIYIGENRFHKIIDIAIRELLPDKSVAFVRVSGHPPVEYRKTWDPSGTGPFKQLLAEPVRDRRAS